VLRLVKNDYDKFKEKSETLREENKEKFSMEKMKDVFMNLIKPYTVQPKEHNLVLPKLTKIK
jgi:hypothetical protein